MTVIPTISITTPELESRDLEMNSPLTPNMPNSPTVFDFVKSMEDVPELQSDDELEDEEQTIKEDQQQPIIIISEEPEELNHNDTKKNISSSSSSSSTTTKQQQQQEKEELIITHDIKHFYKDKTIFITGATGFIGKALLWKLLSTLHDDIDQIFLLIRMNVPHKRYSNPSTRLHDEILSNKAFVNLRRQLGTTVFDQLIKDKVKAINGDLLELNLGLSENDYFMAIKNTNIIFHCAANTDWSEHLDLSVKANALGTNNILNFANECGNVSSFIHLSPLQLYGSIGLSYNTIGGLPNDDTVEDIISLILNTKNEELPILFNQFKPYYPNTYLFSKSLAEHILISDIQQKQRSNFQQFPIGIIRLSPVGPSVLEPLKGWADDVNGANGVILLTGRGTRVIDTGHSDVMADVIPVDYAVRTMISCAAIMKLPSSNSFLLPKIDDIRPTPEKTSSTPIEGTTTRDSVSSSSSTTTAPPMTTITSSPNINTFNNNSVDKEVIISSSESNHPMNYFPYIYPISAANLHGITWKQAYEAIRFYWIRATGIQLPPSTSYFTVSAQGLSRARTMMNSIRSAASGYMNSNNATSTINSVSNDSRSRFTNKRGSHRITKYVDKAARISPHVMKSYTIPVKKVSTTTTTSSSSSSNNNNTINDSNNLLYKSPTMDQLLNLIQKDINYNNHYNSNAINNTNNDNNKNSNNNEDDDDHNSNHIDDNHSNMIFDPYYIIQENEMDPIQFWMEYFTNASFGMHYFVGNEGNTRLLIPKEGWYCALQFNERNERNDSRSNNSKSDAHFVIDHQVYSELFSLDQIQKRNTRMIDHLKHLLTQDEAQKPQDEQDWITDINDCLEDWCQDQTVANAEHDKRLVLGKWRKKVGSNDDTVKIVVLNDKRVNQAIHQITQNAGVSKQTAINEAMKILLRMSERTQLTYVWFVGSFLKSFFDNLFESIRVSEDSIRYIRQSILGKRVVYVPVSKSILDPLLVWFITIRYQLPVPALICDEVMTQLGPISDIYRLAGAYYVKRDKTQRSPLNSAVTAAYTQVLLREHGALSMCLEKSRTRTGKYQGTYDDELIEMIMESTLQSNQSRSSAAVVTTTKVAASDMISPPDSPDSTSPSLSSNPTMSLDSTTGLPRKAHRDVVIVPINISYEDVPELSFLIDQVLDQQTRNAAIGMNGNMNGGNGGKQSLLLSTQSSMTATSLPNVVRPSQAMDKRNRLLDGIDTPKKCGRVHFGIGRLVSVQDVANEFSKSNNNIDESVLANKIIGNVQQNQRDALVVTSISLVCAIVLYGRATGGVCLGKIKELLEWLKKETCERQYDIDWQDGEDVDSIIFSVFRLINENKNLIIEGKEMTDDTNIRVNDHADNIMALSYYSNQMVNVFLLDAFFAVIYLSFSEETVSEDDFMDRFRFLVQMLEKEFVLNWNVETQFKAIMTTYEKSKVIRRNRSHQLSLAVKLETDPVRYEQLIFLASLIYPTIDTYWITSCSLSALECVPTLPRSIVPLLSQWIATHLITGRRTIYREVLSTESSRTAVDVFMSMGFLTEFQAKEKLSPDAQILLHELKIPTTETLIELTGQNSDGGMTPVSPNDPEGMMKALMAQIQMNRANSNMADLCQQIDSYRLGAASQRESFQNAQVFQKCLKQIKGILKVDISFSKKRNVELNEVEDGLVQLVHSLKVNSVSSNDSRALRRISQAYNLK